MSETIELTALPVAARERYLRYAMSVITSRAIPDVRDGLKPVQRRILYAMETDLALGGGDAKYKKSAQVTGRVMGVYHPHGDQAIYDAMVRMAQGFSLRYPLVDGHGNFGSISPDPPAAARYTEVRLRPIASELVTLLGEETVPFRPTYDSTTTEPVVFPVPAPLLLVNGTTGIAVGMATNIPPHNLGEVTKAAAHLVDNPEATAGQLMRWIRGPDFPTGGEVLTKRDDLRAIYETGRGSFKLRGTWKIEEGEKGKRGAVGNSSLVITSIPYGTTLEMVIKEIADIVRAKKVPHALDVRDETTAREGVRIVVELKKDSDPAELAAYLYKHTPLQINYSVNMTCLVPTANPLVGRPEVLDLRALLRHFLDFRFEVVTKSLEFRLRKLEERIHLLEGFLTIYDQLDVAIKIIRSAEDKADAQAKLMKRFGLDEVQTDAILELRLWKLAKLEVEKIRDELAEKRSGARKIEKLLKGPRPRWALIRDELLAFGEKHGDKRRTHMVGADEVTYDAEAYIAKEDTNVVVTRLGLVKRVRSLVDPSATRVHEDDRVSWILQGSTRAEAVLFSNTGSAYVAKLNDAPATTGYGDPIQKLFKFGDGERLVAALSLDARITPRDEDAHLLVVTAHGHVLRAPLAPHREVSTRSGRRFVRLEEGDEVVAVELVTDASPKATVVLATLMGYVHRFPLADVPLVAGVGKGLRGMKLEKSDRVIAGTAKARIVLETTRGAEEVLLQKNQETGERGTSGTVAKQRGGYARALPPEPSLVELEPEPEPKRTDEDEG